MVSRDINQLFYRLLIYRIFFIGREYFFRSLRKCISGNGTSYLGLDLYGDEQQRFYRRSGGVSDAHASLSVSVFHEVSIALRDSCLEQQRAEEAKEKKKEREMRFTCQVP